MHEVLVNRLGGLSLPRKSVVRLADRPDMTLDVYGGCKTTMQQQQSSFGLPTEICVWYCAHATVLISLYSISQKYRSAFDGCWKLI